MHDDMDYDVAVIGGGPSGSAAGREAARLGLRTIVIEKDPFPRFHIGESLLPYMSGLLHELGLLEEVEREGHPVKAGAEFSNTDGQFHRVSFTDQGPGRFHTTFQVDRARFDEFLIDAAAAAGATVVTRAEVVDVDLAEDNAPHRIGYITPAGRKDVRASIIIDASGRTGWITTSRRLRRPVEELKMVALFKHYAGVREEDNPGWVGDIQIGNHPDGWVWAIPNARGMLSIGTVMRKPTLRAAGDKNGLFEDHLSRVPRIVERLGDAVATAPVRQEADFCYYSEQVAGNRWYSVGDASAFVDPVFSGGVYLGMVSGRAAATEAACVLDGSRPMSDSVARFTSMFKTGYDTYFRLVQGFYEYNFDFGRFRADLPESVDDRSISLLLGGDFWGQANKFAAELRKIERWRVFDEFEVFHGCPAYPQLELAERVSA